MRHPTPSSSGPISNRNAPLSNRNAGTNRVATKQEQTIPVVKEDLQVGKQTVETGGVRVTSNVVEQPVQRDVQLKSEHVHVERRPVNRPAGTADLQGQREVIEMTERAEQPIVQKTARVVEEVVVSKDVETHTSTIRDNLRHVDVDVQKLGHRDRGGWDQHTSHFHDYHRQHDRSGLDYTRAEPAYRYGYVIGTSDYYKGRDWNAIERDARPQWEKSNPGTWEQVKEKVRYAWMKVSGHHN